MTDSIQETKTRMQAAIKHLETELHAIRAGKANPGVVESVHVEVYGATMRIKDVAAITSPEMRQLVVTPFDAHNVQPCAKAIEKANLGVTTAVEGKIIRIIFPELDAKRRTELIGQAHKKREETKIAIRNVRRDINEILKKQKADGILPEDEFKRQEKHVQELTDKFCKEADDFTATKEKEIAKV